jgi:hypothetical protein
MVKECGGAMWLPESEAEGGGNRVQGLRAREAMWGHWRVWVSDSTLRLVFAGQQIVMSSGEGGGP